MYGDPYPVIEAASLALFAVACVLAARRGRQALIEVLSAAVYGLLLEQGDILIFGSYKYASGFHIVIYDVPVAIGLCWAVIIYGAMRISDGLGLPLAARPAFDALLALGMDFAFDAVAIRQGLWHWNIALDQAYFGVPAGNFYAWLFVAFGFSYLTRRIRSGARRPALAQALTPLGAYCLLLLALVPFVVVRRFLFTAPGGGSPAVVLVVVVFAAISIRAWPHRQPAGPGVEVFPIASRLAFHGYFLGAIYALGIYRSTPVLLGVSLVLLAGELALAVLSMAPLLARGRSSVSAPGLTGLAAEAPPGDGS